MNMEGPFLHLPLKEIYLIRHGETEWTLSGQHTGRTDIALTERGKEQARSLGKAVKARVQAFTHVFSSPSKRALDTCKISGFSEKVVVDPDLQEWDYGDYEGKTSIEIHENSPGWTIFSEDPPAGETALQINERADRVIDRLRTFEGTIALFSSGHFLRSLTARWVGEPVSFGEHLLLVPGSISILSFEHGYPVIRLWNEIV